MIRGMPWFKVDDSYWSHPKVLLSDLEARGVWVTAASWCAQHMTDGRIPIGVLHKLIPLRRPKVDVISEELEHLGLWERDGDEWVFHDWTDYNPTRQQIDAERRNQRERQRRFQESKRRRDGRFGATNGVTDGVTDGVTNATPSHPLKGWDGTPSLKDPHPCPHGADSPRMCAFCRRQEPTDVA